MNIIGRTGHYSIVPSNDLLSTAGVVSKALGIALAFDHSSRFDEYPAFVGSNAEFEIALLGIPLPEDDLNEPPTNEFNLRVTVLTIFQGLQSTDDIDVMVLYKLRNQGALICLAEGWGE